MSAEKNVVRAAIAHSADRVLQAFAIAGGVSGAWRAESPKLAIGQIATQDCETGIGESVANRYQNRRVCIRACAMREAKRGGVRRAGIVPEPAHRGIYGRVGELLERGQVSFLNKARRPGLRPGRAGQRPAPTQTRTRHKSRQFLPGGLQTQIVFDFTARLLPASPFPAFPGIRCNGASRARLPGAWS